MKEVIVIPVDQDMLTFATAVAARRAKRTEMSPPLAGDNDRPDRDLVGVVCELAYYQWRYGSWRARQATLENERVGRGLTDGNEDDVGINVRGSYLPESRALERQHLLISIDRRNGGKLVPHIRYLAAFYTPSLSMVQLAGYLQGTAIEQLADAHPDYIGTVRPDGFWSYKIPLNELRPVRLLPHAVSV